MTLNLTQLYVRTVHREIFVPSSSDCCNTMDKYNFPTHSGFRRNEFRLNQCPCPGYKSSIPLGVAPNRLSVNQCSFRFRMNASCVLRRKCVKRPSERDAKRTGGGSCMHSSLRFASLRVCCRKRRIDVPSAAEGVRLEAVPTRDSRLPGLFVGPVSRRNLGAHKSNKLYQVVGYTPVSSIFVLLPR